MKVFEIAIYKKKGIIYGVCPQLGLVIDDKDQELVWYRMMYQIQYYISHPKCDKIKIPKLLEEAQTDFNETKIKYLKKEIKKIKSAIKYLQYWKVSNPNPCVTS